MSDGVAPAGAATFAARIRTRSEQLASHVCLGIDPRPDAHPLTHTDRFDGDPAKVARAVVHYFQAIIETTVDLVACYKLQSAFFERLGIPGLIAMAQLLADLRGQGIPVILDVKRGDVASTAEAYADAYLADGVFSADAITVNPYLGLDALEPFLNRASRVGKGVLVLLKTSNPGSGDLQDLRLEDGSRVWEHLAKRLSVLAADFSAGGDSALGAVVGATYPAELARARELLPADSLLLVPGYGAQGGDASAVRPAFAGGGLAVVSASRSLTYFGPDDDFPSRARSAVTRMRDELNDALG